MGVARPLQKVLSEAMNKKSGLLDGEGHGYSVLGKGPRQFHWLEFVRVLRGLSVVDYQALDTWVAREYTKRYAAVVVAGDWMNRTPPMPAGMWTWPA